MGERLAVETADLRKELAAENAGLRKELAAGTAGLREDLAAGIAGLRGELVAGLARQDDSIAGLKKDVGTLQSALLSVRTDLMARMDRLQNKMSAVSDDITVNYGAVEQTDRIARSASAETRALAQTVSAMQRQIRRIAAKVFGDDDLES
jgi:hypothetical protein